MSDKTNKDKIGKEDMNRFGDWATANVPILPIDDPKVQQMMKDFGQFVAPKGSWKTWPKDPPTIENMHFHKKGAKK